MTIQTYIQQLSAHHATGHAREHSYRPHLQNLLEGLLPNVMVINEPKRQKVGAPDFILTQKKTNIPLSYIETKDIGADLDSKLHKEQFDRYKSGLDVLLITDYMEFRLYRRGVLVRTVRIAELKNGKVLPCTDDMFDSFEATVQQLQQLLTTDLVTKEGVLITIRSAEDLAVRMAQKARFFADVLYRALKQGDTDFEIADGSLYQQYKAFQQILISDISYKDFADIYAQTIAYGMFVARLHDKTLEDFSRQEAATLIPKSNPFLRKLFQYVASNDLDDRIAWMIDELAEVFRFTDVKAILSDFDRKTGGADPMIHFYETFLVNYDPALRKARGVWYTPEPIVNFIVRAVDDVLKNDFALKDGLANISKIKIPVKIDTSDKKPNTHITIQKEVHRVQVLDPATGTGTFLAATITHIYQKFRNQAGIWNNYVENHLIPRLHGFELLMASYAMAHIKMDMLLRETGFTLERKNRFQIFLTNALEDHHTKNVTLFGAQWLADEAHEADAVKRDAPIMVVMGNPPYSVSSSNKSVWIEKLMVDYKKNLNERNIQPLSDDYIKFIRLAQYYIEKNKEGIVAYISNNSFLDGLIHRQMRKQLLDVFDTIYIIDLHGNAKKKETAPDGSADQNVFDIMQGVSINIFVKTGKKAKGALAKVLHTDLQGKRNFKYDFLNESSLKTLSFTELTFDDDNFFFVKKDFSERSEYEEGFKIDELFGVNSMGITTGNDKDLINFNKNDFDKKFENQNFIKKIAYRIFDERYIYYDTKIVERSRTNVMENLINGDNLALISLRGVRNNNVSKFGISNNITDKSLVSSLDNGYVFPLYLYTSDLLGTARTPNLDEKIAQRIAAGLGLKYVYEKTEGKEATELAPIDILDYIYAVLHTPAYRARYVEFLKIDFPRVPYPLNPPKGEAAAAQVGEDRAAQVGEDRAAQRGEAAVEQGEEPHGLSAMSSPFGGLRGLGGELRQYHLLTHPDIDDYITTYPQGGDNTVGKIVYDNGCVYINAQKSPFGGAGGINGGQYFGGVTESVWNFYIGGYQPAQKWLKDRVGRKLDYEEVLHYQRIIVALHHTHRIMQELDLMQ